MAYDFVQNAGRQGNTLYILTIMDDFTREGLAIDVDSFTSAERVRGVLNALFALNRAPNYLRSENGAEFVALALQVWLAEQHVEPLYIDPGCQGQNGKDKRFN